MANTLALTGSKRARAQFQGLFSDMWIFEASVTDQDAVTATDTASFDLTIPGVALGDFVLLAPNNDLSDGTDQAIMTGTVTAADTVTVRVHADAGAYAADDLNNAVIKGVVLRPAWDF